MEGNCCFENFADHLCRFVGETVTIYTTSGGAAGCGITGVVLMVNACFLRLVTCIGPAPCCSLGSACNTCGCPCFNGCRSSRGVVNTVGSVCDIPIERIASFCHNAV
jgi:hypothetical protein